MTDIEKARQLFRDAGLDFPTIPKELAAQLKERGRWPAPASQPAHLPIIEAGTQNRSRGTYQPVSKPPFFERLKFLDDGSTADGVARVYRLSRAAPAGRAQ